VNNVSSTDGITGTALAREHQIDTIVVDFNMPDLDGNQVTQVLLMKEHPTQGIGQAASGTQVCRQEHRSKLRQAA
jgi:CheY-like chemotaxis protein